MQERLENKKWDLPRFYSVLPEFNPTNITGYEDWPFLLNTGIRSCKKYLMNLPPPYGDAKSLNCQLHKMVRVAEDIFGFCPGNAKENPLQFLKNTFTPDFDVSMLEKRKAVTNNLDVYFQFDTYIESKRRKIAPLTVNLCMEVKKYLQVLIGRARR